MASSHRLTRTLRTGPPEVRYAAGRTRLSMAQRRTQGCRDLATNARPSSATAGTRMPA